jgi:hypothetical protein
VIPEEPREVADDLGAMPLAEGRERFRDEDIGFPLSNIWGTGT